MSSVRFNGRGVWAIYKFEMARFRRTWMQSLVTPVITTSLYFVVFGAAIGSRMSEVGGVPYGAFIVPGLIMLSLLTESLSNASLLATASLFVPLKIMHPAAMVAFLLLTAVSFSLFGFITGIWAKGFEHLQFVPMLVITPLTFLGGAFYSIDMLPPAWRTITLFNPVVYLISGFRWSFYGSSDVSVGWSLAATLGFFALCLVLIVWIFKTGYRLKN